MKYINPDAGITPQSARVEFKSWSIAKQRKFLLALLEEHAYHCGFAGDDFNFESFKSPKIVNAFVEGAEHKI